MSHSSQNIKEKMLEFTRLFSIERNIFQRFVIVYKYIKFLNTDPLTRDILQKVFDDTAKIIGETDSQCFNEKNFVDVDGDVLFSREFWTYYSNLEIVYHKMKKLKTCEIDDKKEFDKLCRLFSKPYSKAMFKLSFDVVNSEVFDRLDREKFLKEADKEPKTYFNEKKSILCIKGYKIKINKQDKITNPHKILNYIFITNKDNITDNFYYSEIAEDEFHDHEYKANKNNWKIYHNACSEMNNKIKNQTDDNIKNFLVINTGRKGRVKINKKYL